ncbi:phosphomannomutase [Consotaella aegiceratis]|uniref:phosphomannomutase n=1 Tax=Consotaella aegiceratis TaxID=3097961 RepID=UPI002F3FBB37
MTSLKFGTSGLRGLVVDLVGWPSTAYALAFLRHVSGESNGAREVLLGHDLRASSPDILRACVAAANEAGFTALSCGAVPTPALAYAALGRGSPAIMITGSHIPDDRNGLKFYTAAGEITKADEAAIAAGVAGLLEHAAPQAGLGADSLPLAALPAFHDRILDFFGPDALKGLTVGVYQHSSVARDFLVDLLQALGADARPLGRADRFVPVDTEAHRPEDIELIAGWAAGSRYDAIVSTDGDADRPLVADEAGTVLRGDVIGLLTARHLGLTTIVTPVTSCSAIETSGVATDVIRTRVGSPFVIAGMEEALRSGSGAAVVGFEANGGVLLGSDLERDGRRISALPTRDSILPIVSVLAEIKRSGRPLSDLVDDLGTGHTAAHRLQHVGADRSGPFLARLAEDADYRSTFFAPVGAVARVNGIDGVRSILQDGSVLHFRASGNAPELRCYVEAASPETARHLLDWGLARAGEAVARSDG